MERGSDKHSPRIDDEMSSEAEPLVRSGAESHVEPSRTKEGAAPDPLETAGDDLLEG